MNDQPATANTANPGRDFLIAEFEGLRDARADAANAIDKRTDTLITVVSALGAGLGLLSQSHIAPHDFLILTLFTALSLLLVSSSTFRETISHDILSTNYMHAINRIRQYFAENPTFAIGDYLLLPLNYTYPPYGKFTRNRSTIGLLDCILAAAAAATAYMWSHSATFSTPTTILIGGLAFIASGCAHIHYSLRQYRLVQTRAVHLLHTPHRLAGSMEYLETGKPTPTIHIPAPVTERLSQRPLPSEQ